LFFYVPATYCTGDVLYTLSLFCIHYELLCVHYELFGVYNELFIHVYKLGLQNIVRHCDAIRAGY